MNVSAFSRIRQQQLLQEAEGYLDLIRIASWPAPLNGQHRRRLAERAIAVLNQDAIVENARTVYLRGQAYRLMGKNRLAILSLRKAVVADPLNVRIYLALAWCYKRTGRLDLAIEALRRARECGARQGLA